MRSLKEREALPILLEEKAPWDGRRGAKPKECEALPLIFDITTTSTTFAQHQLSFPDTSFADSCSRG